MLHDYLILLISETELCVEHDESLGVYRYVSQGHNLLTEARMKQKHVFPNDVNVVAFWPRDVLGMSDRSGDREFEGRI